MTDTTNQIDPPETGTAIALPDQRGIVALFASPQAVDTLLSEIEAVVAKHPPQDLNQAKGRKSVASLAYQVARTKTVLDDAGKRLNEDARRQISVVDAERRKIRDRCDRLQAIARAPLDQWEAQEQKRITALRTRLAIFDIPSFDETDTAAAIEATIVQIEDIEIGPDWQEFQERALQTKDAALRSLRPTLRAARAREEQQAEIARLRAEAEARAAAENARLAAESKERARLQTERDEAARLAALEAERQAMAERALRDAEARAAQIVAAEAAQAEQLRQKVLAEAAALRQAEADQAAAHLKAAADREARLQLDLELARSATDRAAQDERDRLEAIRLAEQEARELRQADAKHRAHIRSDIAAALRTLKAKASPEIIADALMDGKIPHITVHL